MLYKTHNALLSIDKDKLYLEALYRWSLPPSKALTKRTRKSTQVCKPQLAYGLARGGQTDSQVGSQVAKSRKFHAYNWLMTDYLSQLAPGGQTVKNLRLLASKFELDQSQRKSKQVGGQTKHKLLVSTCESVWPGLFLLLFYPRRVSGVIFSIEGFEDGKIIIILRWTSAVAASSWPFPTDSHSVVGEETLLHLLFSAQKMFSVSRSVRML